MIAGAGSRGHARVVERLAARVVIVDDQETFRLAARTVVQVSSGFVLVGEAVTGEDGVSVVNALEPDVVLMDINLPGIDGIEATRRILADHPDIVVILMSTYAAEALPVTARTCGAARYVHKEDLSPAVLREVLDEFDRAAAD